MLVQFILGVVFIIFSFTLVFALPLIINYLNPKNKTVRYMEDCDVIFTDDLIPH
jgi:membrane-anchored glycerophosphoryl diester phosphodiesterase (GDPDase)